MIDTATHCTKSDSEIYKFGISIHVGVNLCCQTLWMGCQYTVIITSIIIIENSQKYVSSLIAVLVCVCSFSNKVSPVLVSKASMSRQWNTRISPSLFGMWVVRTRSGLCGDTTSQTRRWIFWLRNDSCSFLHWFELIMFCAANEYLLWFRFFLGLNIGIIRNWLWNPANFKGTNKDQKIYVYLEGPQPCTIFCFVLTHFGWIT